MSGLSATFWLIATGIVLLLFIGSWMAVRVLRARRPTPEILDRQTSQHAGTPSPRR